ncbi:MAG TPA: proteasome activator, partial [Acidimicrobiales bacterium]
MADTTNDDMTTTEAAELAGAGADGVVSPDEVLAGVNRDESEEERQTESVNEPAKVLRIGSMVKTLLDEVRSAPLDEKSRVRLR